MPICHFSGILTKRRGYFSEGDELFVLPRRIGPPRAHVFPCAAGSSLVAVQLSANGAGAIVQGPASQTLEQKLSIGGIITPVQSVDDAPERPTATVTAGERASIAQEGLGPLEPCKCVEEKNAMIVCGAIQIPGAQSGSNPSSRCSLVAVRVFLGKRTRGSRGEGRSEEGRRAGALDAAALTGAVATTVETRAAEISAAAAAVASTAATAITPVAVTAAAAAAAAETVTATTSTPKSKRLLYIVMLRETGQGRGSSPGWRPAIAELAWNDEHGPFHGSPRVLGRDKARETETENLTVWLHDTLSARSSRGNAPRIVALGALPFPHTRDGVRASKRVGARSMNTALGVQPIKESGDWKQYEPLTLLEQDHIVYLRGLVARQGAFKVGDVILKFPSAYVPAKLNSFYALSGYGPPSGVSRVHARAANSTSCIFRLDIRQDGTVKVASRCFVSGGYGGRPREGSRGGCREFYWLSLSNVSFRRSGIVSRFDGQTIESSVRRIMFRRGFGDCGGSARVCSVYVPGGHASMVPENRHVAEDLLGDIGDQRRPQSRGQDREEEHGRPRRRVNQRGDGPAAARGGFLALAAQVHETETRCERQQQGEVKRTEKRAGKPEFSSLKSELGASGMQALGDSGMQHLGRQVYMQLQNVPDHLLCPISLSVFKDPAVTRCGHTFERKSIIKALRVSSMCPVCRKQARVADLTTNYGIKASVEEHNKLKDLAKAMLRLKRSQQAKE